MVFPVRQEFTIAVAACSSVMALSPPTTVAAASASRRARSHRAIACRNTCRAGVNSRCGCASRTSGGSAGNVSAIRSPTRKPTKTAVLRPTCARDNRYYRTLDDPDFRTLDDLDYRTLEGWCHRDPQSPSGRDYGGTPDGEI